MVCWAVVPSAPVSRLLQLCDPHGALPTAAGVDAATQWTMLPRVHRKRIDLTVLSSGPGLLAGTPAVHVNRLAPGDEVRLTGSPEAGAVCSTTGLPSGSPTSAKNATSRQRPLIEPYPGTRATNRFGEQRRVGPPPSRMTGRPISLRGCLCWWREPVGFGPRPAALAVVTIPAVGRAAATVGLRPPVVASVIATVTTRAE